MVTTSSHSNWITHPQTNPQALIRLFCFPYAGGGASVFRTWSKDLPSQIEVCPIQLPGRENRLKEAPITRLLPLVQTLAQVLRPHLNKPFAFFGHSMGAMISFELARLLYSQNSPVPVHLFVSGRQAPQIPDRNLPMHELPLPAFIKELRRYNGIREEVLQNAELMEILIPLLRADFTLINTYIYSKSDPLDCPISAFGGLSDNLVSQEDLMPWRDYTTNCFKLRMLKGDHFFLHSERAGLLESISKDLSQLF